MIGCPSRCRRSAGPSRFMLRSARSSGPRLPHDGCAVVSSSSMASPLRPHRPCRARHARCRLPTRPQDAPSEPSLRRPRTRTGPTPMHPAQGARRRPSGTGFPSSRLPAPALFWPRQSGAASSDLWRSSGRTPLPQIFSGRLDRRPDCWPAGFSSTSWRARFRPGSPPPSSARRSSSRRSDARLAPTSSSVSAAPETVLPTSCIKTSSPACRPSDSCAFFPFSSPASHAGRHRAPVPDLRDDGLHREFAGQRSSAVRAQASRTSWTPSERVRSRARRRLAACAGS